MTTVRIRVPSTVKQGELFEIRTLIQHPMESGQRVDDNGRPVPRKILRRFVCTYNGVEVIAADWHPAVASNPYLAFFARAGESGSIEFAWTDDDGTLTRETATIQVT
ncbi:MAG: thiosulfate oxidation carrier complex protein SoxZ [Alphaproteobacteria bacterium]|nr:thiosulfate oxidation carrier complex protein SoxZ [Alphaproteobacteria bacterium]